MDMPRTQSLKKEDEDLRDGEKRPTADSRTDIPQNHFYTPRDGYTKSAEKLTRIALKDYYGETLSQIIFKGLEEVGRTK